MKLSVLGESEVIAVLGEMSVRNRKVVDVGANSHDFQLRVDIGDDTAAFIPGSGTELLTTDTIVEGVHFIPGLASWWDLGWKIMAANVSDVAAMGGEPLYALVTLGLPPETEIEDLQSLYMGMLELGNRYGVLVVGGDIVRSSLFFATVAMTGVTRCEPMLRSEAKMGDLIAVTGFLGSAAGGFRLSRDGATDEWAELLRVAHFNPIPCVPEGVSLARNGVKAAIDISDGLLEDLSKLCRASEVAAVIDPAQIPVLPALKKAFPQEYMNLAMAGGEDYQLLFTAQPDVMNKNVSVSTSPVSIIGNVVEGEIGDVAAIDGLTGKRFVITDTGWDHFR